MPNDLFGYVLDSLVAPARSCFAVTPSDTGELPLLPKALYIGGGGSLVVRAIDSDADVTFANVAAGTILDIRIIAVRATGTTATNLIGLS